jgi:Protein of unknown function (DUF2511)
LKSRQRFRSTGREGVSNWPSAISSALTTVCAILAGIVVCLLTIQGEDVRKAVLISEAEYGEAWPFTIPRGYLRCVGTGIVVFADGDNDYVLNGNAEMGGYTPVEKIGRATSTKGKARFNFWPILDRGLELCKRER